MKWKPWVSPVLLLTLSVPPAGAAVAPGGQASPSSAPAVSDAGPVEALNPADRGGPRRARRRAETAFRDGVPIESLARAREYLRARAAGERPTAAASRGWERFYGACDGCIRSFAAAMGVRAADLDDCAQDVWSDLMRSLPRFELDSSRGRFTSWLYAIVRSKAADQDRRRSRKPAVSLSPEAEASLAARTDDNPLWLCERDCDRDAVRRAMAALRMQSSEKSYRVLHLRYCQGMSAPQVAGELDLTPQQVWVREHRMKKKLAALLAEYSNATMRAKCA